MNSVAKGALITIATGLLVGVLVVVFEHATYDRPSNPLPSQSAAMQPMASSPPEAETHTPPPASTETDTANSVAPSLDNKTITQSRIEVRGDKISPSVYRTDGPPGYYTKVFTAAGEIEYGAGCYTHWELYNNGTLLTTGDTDCGLQGGWSTAWWPNSTQLDNGTVRVVAKITTDWGSTGAADVAFAVQR